MNVTFVVQVLNDENRTVDAYCKREKLSFMPTVGMKLNVNSKNTLWKTADGEELNPSIKEIVYNLDDDEIYCLFEVHSALTSSYWARIKNMNTNHELGQFKLHNQLANTTECLPGQVGTAEKHKNSLSSTAMMLINIVLPFSVLCYDAIQNLECII